MLEGSPMRRTRTLLATVVSLGALSLLAAAAPAQAAWQQIGCAPTDVRYGRICLDRSTTDSSQARGRYINNSAYDLTTSGFFYKQATSQTIGCASTVTRSGTTSTCLRPLPKGRWELGAYTWRGSE